MRLGLIIVAALLPVPAWAQAGQPAPSLPSERRLTPDQIEAVLAEAARKRETTQLRGAPEEMERVARPPIAGEVGVSVGTGGYREVFGTAIVPMGEDGAAAISLDMINVGRRRDRR